jgi:hypothetical protein
MSFRKTVRWPVMLVLAFPLAAGHIANVRAGGENSVVQEISLKGLEPGGKSKTGAPKQPVVLNDVQDLSNVLFGAGPADMEFLAKIAKQVDFQKQQLLYFRWAGSGQDTIKPVVKMAPKGALVVFEYTPGLTRDLRQHAKLFVIARGAKWEIVTKPFKGK